MYFGNFDFVSAVYKRAAEESARKQSTLPPTPTIIIDLTAIFPAPLLFYRTEFAQLLADIAADAKGEVNVSLALFHAYRGAADLHAHLAGGAFVGVDFDGWLGLNIFEKYAGTAGYNYRGSSASSSSFIAFSVAARS